MITNQIIDGLLTNDLLIADLTDHNPNVFYELAIRHAFGKPFIQLIAEGQELPFDIQNLRTVFLDHTDLDSVAEAKRQLASMIQSVNSGARVDTPLTHTADLQALRQTEGSEARGIIELLGEMSSIKQILQEKGVLRTRAPSPDLAIFRKFIFDLADGGRLSVQDLNTLIDADLTAAHANWIKDKIYPLVAKNEEPPF